MLNQYIDSFLSPLLLCCVLGLAGCATVTGVAPVQVNAGAHWVNACSDWDDWDKPGPPFRIFGNSYYVGTCGISAILVTGDRGHVLIDGGTEAGADIIVANIKALGFSIRDVKRLLHSHEHFDHIAGLAKLQKLSEAKLLASPEAAPVLRTGITADVDPQAGMHKPFPAVRVDGTVNDGDVVRLGHLSLTAIATPGHTAGALSWQWRSCEQDHCVSIVYADSLSPMSRDDYHFSDHPSYVEAYKEGLGKLAKLDCQILIAPHPSASQMRERLAAPEGLIDPHSCETYTNSVSKRLSKRLLKEKGIDE